MNENPLATIPAAAYEQPVWKARGLFGHQLTVSDPAGIKRVLLDNYELREGAAGCPRLHPLRSGPLL
jgi:hypothetical protein